MEIKETPDAGRSFSPARPLEAAEKAVKEYAKKEIIEAKGPETERNSLGKIAESETLEKVGEWQDKAIEVVEKAAIASIPGGQVVAGTELAVEQAAKELAKQFGKAAVREAVGSLGKITESESIQKAAGMAPYAMEAAGLRPRARWEDVAIKTENTENVFELDAVGEGRGEWNPETELLNSHPLPAESVFRVKMGGETIAEFKTDKDGRVESVHVDRLKLVPQEERLFDGNRTKLGRAVKDGLETDDGGHIVADEFGGTSHVINIVPMDGEINKHGEWRRMEKEIENALKGPPTRAVTDFDVKINYNGNSSRPGSFVVSFKVEGDEKPKTYVISNKPSSKE